MVGLLVSTLQAKLQEEPSDTPLQEKLDAMAAMIGYVGMACAAATFVATMCVYFTTHRVSEGNVQGAVSPLFFLPASDVIMYVFVSLCSWMRKVLLSPV